MLHLFCGLCFQAHVQACFLISGYVALLNMLLWPAVTYSQTSAVTGLTNFVCWLYG